MNIQSRFLRTSLALATTLAPSLALAAGTNTGVEAGFFQLGADLNTILTGAGGFVILIASVLVGGATYMATGRVGAAATSLGVALFLGYGVTVLTSLSGVTASIDMIDLAQSPAPASLVMDGPPTS